MNPYRKFVSDWAELVQQGKGLPLGGLAMPEKPKIPAGAPKALIFSPHPDDEVIIGGLPLRLLRELKMNVINVAVTQGSNKARQPERWQELSACCNYIGFGLVATKENGLEGINLKTRTEQPKDWQASVDRIVAILSEHHPRVIFYPHVRDWNSSHIGTHHLVVDALVKIGGDLSCLAVETEFWGAMDNPNLMVESNETDVADLIAALSFHVGEVRRNPYHLRMPAWLMDNVRRGGELVGGQGGAAPDFTFATLYRLLRWTGTKFESILDRGRFVSRTDNLSSLFSP
jgi:LmbE family N-acetylglucosaminyl deacetylase